MSFVADHGTLCRPRQPSLICRALVVPWAADKKRPAPKGRPSRSRSRGAEGNEVALPIGVSRPSVGRFACWKRPRPGRPRSRPRQRQRSGSTFRRRETMPRPPSAAKAWRRGEASWWLRILPRAASLRCSRKRDWTWRGDTILSMRSALRIIPNCEHSGAGYQPRSGNSPRISNPTLSTPFAERFGSSPATVSSARGVQEDARASALASSVQATRPLVSSSACRSNSRR